MTGPGLRFVDEYRRPELIKSLVSEIERRSKGQTLKIMEVCGGHTHAIYKHGLEDLLPPSIDLWRLPNLR